MRYVRIAALAGALVAALLFVDRAMGSRNSSGTMSVPNTFVTGAASSAPDMNTNFSDFATEMTDSLNRSGKGGMLAALRGVDGTVAAPALSFTSETGTGLYRIGSSDLGLSINGTKKLELTGTLFTVTPDTLVSGKLGVGVSPTTTLHVLKGGSSGATPNSGSAVVVEQNTTNFLSLLAPNANSEAIIFGDVANASRGQIQYYNSAHGSADQMQFGTNGTIRAVISNSGVTIGTSGTAIGSIYRVSASHTPGSIAANSCQTSGSTITVTGAASGNQCLIGGPGPTALAPFCYVTSANTVQPYFCNPGTGAATPASGTYTVTVIQ